MQMQHLLKEINMLPPKLQKQLVDFVYNKTDYFPYFHR